jgi:hypothetical protein
LIALFAGLVITVFVTPQDVLNNNELIFLCFLMPINGWLWIQALSTLGGEIDAFAVRVKQSRLPTNN